MSDTDLAVPWREALNQLNMNAPEAGADEVWQPLYQSFGQRGFVRLTRHRDRNEGRIQLATPNVSVVDTRRNLADMLKNHGFQVVDDTDEDDASAQDEATVTFQVTESDAAKPIVERLVKLLRTVDRAGTALKNDELDGLPDWASESSDASPAGDAETQSTRASDEVFEPIGDSDGSSGDDTPDEEVDFDIDSYNVESEGGKATTVTIAFESPIPSSELDHFVEGLSHALRARYDVNAVLDSDDLSPGPRERIAIRVQPTRTAPEDVDALEQTTAYLDRLIRFQDLGVHAGETLGLWETDDSRPAATQKARTSVDRTADESDDEPSTRGHDTSKRGPTGRQRSDSNTDVSGDSENGVTLGASESAPGEPNSEETTLEESEPESPTGPLEPGQFTDPRLMREDATTSLVDVVLRHPGYRDERMAQVLSILLSLDYPDAKRLVTEAPTHLAWGVGRDRANRMKRVIEDSGGKVVFVEPDSIPG